MTRRSAERKAARRRAHAARPRTSKPAPAPPGAERCAGGADPAHCCVGDPWADLDIAYVRTYGEPLPPAVITVAAERGVEPHALDHHVEGIHGVEPHDLGYADAVSQAADCLLRGGC